MGETASTYAVAHDLFAERLSEVAALFIRYPMVQATSVEIRNGRIEIVAEGMAGVLMNWSRAIPEHRTRTALVSTMYGADEADVLEADHIRVTVRRPLVGPGGVA
jgi:hypothetical protein